MHAPANSSLGHAEQEGSQWHAGPVAGDGAGGRRRPGAPGAQGQPGNHGGCPRLQMEMPPRGWSGILWLQTRIPGGSIRDRHSRDGFPEGIVCTEQRKQLGATPAHFQDSSLRPQHPINHCGGKGPAPRFPVVRPQLRRYCISSRGKGSGHILPLPGEPLSSPSNPRGDPASALQEQRGAGQCGAVTGFEQGAGGGTGQTCHCTQPLPPKAVPRALTSH